MESSSNVFVKLRKDADFIERTMDLVEMTLSKPAQIFQMTKSVEAEQIVQEELRKTSFIITDLKVVMDEANYNVNQISGFLHDVNAYVLDISEHLENLETQLEQFGYCRKPDSDISESTESGIESLSLGSDVGARNGQGDADLTRPAESLDDTRTERKHSIVRELCFSPDGLDC